MEKISYLQAWIFKKSHIHRPGYGHILISAGLKDLIFAGLDMENKYHIRRPGYRKHLISAGLDMKKNSYPQAWIWKKTHIRRPGYGENLISTGLDMEKISHLQAWV